MRSRLVFVITQICLCACLFLSIPAHAKRLALVIGNDNYTFVSKLQKAGNDATSMARELRAAGFAVQLHKDLNYRGMVKAVEGFANSITGGDEVVVFFAGHGVQIKNGSYLLPTDIEAASEKEVEKTAYELLALTDMISEAKPAFTLVVIDACRDNPIKTNGRSVGNARGLSAIEPPKGQMVVFSASRGQQALDRLSDKDPNPNGVFTREFISRMKKPGVKIEDIIREVQDSVESLAKTINHEQRPAFYNEARGNFYFFGPTSLQLVQPSTKPEAIQPSLRPGQVEGLSLADLEREESTRKEWLVWQGRMNTDFEKTLEFKGSADLIIKAWERFLVVWSEDNPNSREDESLRAEAIANKSKAQRILLLTQQPSHQLTNSEASMQLVRIGHVGPLTGLIGHLGKDNEYGARMAIEELNAADLKIGDKQVKFELLAEDDAADPKQGAAAAQKLVDAKVNGVIGHLNSGTTIPASQIYNAAGIPQISPSATNPKYTRQGNIGAFRVLADDVYLGNSLGKFAVLNLKGKSIAVIDDRTAYGYGMAEEFKKGATSVGGTIVAHEFTNDNASDFTPILSRLKKYKLDIIFFGGMDDVAASILRQMNSMGIKAKFLGGDGICTSELALLARGAMRDDTIFCAEAGGVLLSQKARMDKFRTDFEAKYKTEVQIYAPYAYDAVMTMATAMVIAGSAEPEKYLPALKTIKHKGVTGLIEFDEKGDLKNGAISFYTYRNRERIAIGVMR